MTIDVQAVLNHHAGKVVVANQCFNRDEHNAHLADLVEYRGVFLRIVEAGYVLPNDDEFGAAVSAYHDALAATERAGRKAAVKEEAARRILAAYPLWKQMNAALGLYDAATVAEMTSYINAVRLASDVIEARLAVDLNLDPATQPEWP